MLYLEGAEVADVLGHAAGELVAEEVDGLQSGDGGEVARDRARQLVLRRDAARTPVRARA